MLSCTYSQMATGLASSCLDRLNVHGGFFVHLSGTWAGWGTLLLFGLSTWLGGTSQHADLKVVRLLPRQLVSPRVSMLRDQGRKGKVASHLALEAPLCPFCCSPLVISGTRSQSRSKGKRWGGCQRQATIFNSPPHVSHPLRAVAKTSKDGMLQSH